MLTCKLTNNNVSIMSQTKSCIALVLETIQLEAVRRQIYVKEGAVKRWCRPSCTRDRTQEHQLELWQQKPWRLLGTAYALYLKAAWVLAPRLDFEWDFIDPCRSILAQSLVWCLSREERFGYSYFMRRAKRLESGGDMKKKFTRVEDRSGMD